MIYPLVTGGVGKKAYIGVGVCVIVNVGVKVGVLVGVKVTVNVGVGGMGVISLPAVLLSVLKIVSSK